MLKAKRKFLRKEKRDSGHCILSSAEVLPN